MWHKTRKTCWVLLLFLAGVPAFASINSSLAIKGSEQPGDAGQITISFDGISETVAYGQYSTSASVASTFGALFSRDFASKLCAHAVGSTVLFTVKGDAVLGPVAVSGSAVSFQVDTSLWPTNLINALVELECDPSSITSGNASSCTASVGGTATGSVAFSLDGGSPFATIPLSSGAATYPVSGSGSNVFSGAAIGTHLITAMYSGDASHTAGGVTASVTIRPVAGSLTPATIYSYLMTQPDGITSGYAANGNVQAYIDSINGTWSNIGYDSLNRLTGAQQAPVVGTSLQYFCWVYDSFGNRTLQASAPGPFQAGSTNCQPSSGVAATTYAEGYDTSNHLTSTPLSNPTPDASGNLLSDDMNQYLYDDEGRVCAVKAPPFIAGTQPSLTQYVYDANGTRVAKGAITSFSCDMASNGFILTNSYALDQEGHQVTETDGNDQWMHTNVYAGGMLLATYDDDGTHFHITDWLGSRRVQADYLGRVEEIYQNLPFGELTPNNNTAFLGATEQHFTGKERDAESGLDYFGARYYASNMGRFLSPDWSAKEEPIPYAKLDDPQSLNLYAYVRNNPLSQTDVDGHQQPQPPTITCTGTAYVLKGNSRNVGHEGAPGVTVTNGSAAVVPRQWTGADGMGPTLRTIGAGTTGTVTGPNGQKETFSTLTQPVGEATLGTATQAQDKIMARAPGALVIEIVGGKDLGTKASVTLTMPNTGQGCPQGTTQVPAPKPTPAPAPAPTPPPPPRPVPPPTH